MKKIMLLLICLLCLTGCSASKTEIQGFSMDAPYHISGYGLSQVHVNKIKELLNNVDHCLSAYLETSKLSALNHYKKLVITNNDYDAKMLSQVISASFPYCNEYFDISIRPVSKLWDFTQEKPTVPDAETITENLKRVGFLNIVLEDDFIYLENGAEIDLGAVAKGYVCDEICAYLNNEIATIDIGGTVKTMGKDITAGVKAPTQDGLLCSFTLPKGKAVATSGSYERNFTVDGETYHHILNPKTGYPFESEFLSVSVICDSAMEADILATTWFAMEQPQSKNGVDAIFVTKDFKVFATEGIKNLKMLHNDYTLIKEKAE